ncbi:MAG: multidrug ABC transporter permease, partial [Planctomycetota bacterium]
LLMPLWFLSGAVFPIGASKVAAMDWVTLANPLTFGLAGLRRGLNWDAGYMSLPGLPLSLAVTALAGLSMFALGSFVASRPSKADLEL